MKYLIRWVLFLASLHAHAQYCLRGLVWHASSYEMNRVIGILCLFDGLVVPALCLVLYDQSVMLGPLFSLCNLCYSMVKSDLIFAFNKIRMML